MEESRVVDRLARRLAAPAERRSLLAGIAAGLATCLAPSLAAEGHSPKKSGCRRDIDCGYGKACHRHRCRKAVGFAEIDHECSADQDCSSSVGPVVCERTSTTCGCGGGPTAAPGEGGQLECPGAALRCRGSYLTATGAAASCSRDCECAAGLTCQGGFCRPAPAS